jgi:exodeoxyribonuclease-3
MQDYDWIWHAGERPGYAGTVTLYKKDLKLISSKSRFEDIEHFHVDGRVVETKFQDFILLNMYFPNGGERADGTEML